ncbi:4Fe-4S binding protein [Pseudomonadota bacterium]
MHLQTLRLLTRTSFFILFVLAPVFDVFRLDLTQGHFIFLGMDWKFGLESLARGEMSPTIAALNIFCLGFIPIATIVIGGVWVSYKYGRLYCGWLCPHFSVVEVINSFMRRASSKLSVWEKQTLPEKESDGGEYKKDSRYWPLTYIAVIGFAFLWAVSFLTYLLPPDMIYSNLLNGELTRNQALFIGVTTLLLSIEFLFARHLFCRYGCAVGLFQSLAWMCNNNALVIQFDRERGEACRTCTQACDNACPMLSGHGGFYLQPAITAQCTEKYRNRLTDICQLHACFWITIFSTSRYKFVPIFSYCLFH